MAYSTTVLIDDQDTDILYVCPTLHQHVGGSSYNGTWSTPTSDECDKGWFEYTFYGTGIHVQAAVGSGAEYSVKIDDGEFAIQSGSGRYDSPSLPDGKHTISYATGTQKTMPFFDYMTVTPGLSTYLSGKTLVVDDSDNVIVYTGSWSKSPASPLTFDFSNPPYHDTTHWSSSIGDSLTFQFIGSSIAVFGIASNISSEGNISANYTLDGVSKIQSIPKGTLDSVPMVNLFQADVQPGSHILIINITDVAAPRALGIDFFTYEASFDSIPSVPPTSSSSASKDVGSFGLGPKIGIILGIFAGIALVGIVVMMIVGRRSAGWQVSRTKRIPINYPESHTKSYESKDSQSEIVKM